MLGAIKAGLSGIFGKVMFGAITALAAIVLYQWYQNDKLSQDLTTANTSYATLNTQHTTLKDDYDDLKKQFDQRQESNEATGKIEGESTQTQIIYRDRFDLVDKRVEAQVREIRQRYAAQEQTEATKAAEAQEISVVRIDGLWSSFCTNQPEHVSCAVGK